MQSKGQTTTKRNSYLRRIERALDRTLASPWCAESGLMRSVVGGLVEYDTYLIDKFADLGEAWNDRALYAIAMAFAKNAPNIVLTDLAREADKQHRWVEWWDAVGWAENENYAPLLSSLTEARRWAS
jgi:hypothetical protein